MSLLSPVRRTLRRREDAELNLIPLIDIMSVMVAFLLVYSTEVEIVQNSKGVEIPMSTAQTQPKQSVLVMITTEHLFVQGELVTSTAEVRDSKESQIEPLRVVLSRPIASEGTSTAEQAALASREITVLADKSLPYEVVKKVMATCTAAAYGKVSLAVIEKETPVAARPDGARLNAI
jgi:biopolymer transport protein TolR